MSYPAQTRYRMSQHGQSSRDSNYNNMIIKPGMGKIRKPSWCRENETNETVVRILPSLDPNGNWEPFRYSTGARDFGDWIRRYDAVRGFGQYNHTWLLYDSARDPSYNLDSNPAVVLYKAIDRAIAAGQEQPGWAALMRGQRAILSKPTEVYITRVAIFKINNKDIVTGDRGPLGLSDRDLPFFLEWPQSAGAALISKLEERNLTYQGTPESDRDYFHNFYVYGDVVSLDKGAFIRIFREGCDPMAAQAQQNQQGGAPRQLSSIVGQARGVYTVHRRVENRFDVDITPVWNGWSAVLADENGTTEALLRSQFKPWEEVLYFPDHLQQAVWINEGFPPSAVMYAFRDNPEWITETTRARAVNRTTFLPEGRQPQATATTQVVPGLRPVGQVQSPAVPQGAKIGNWASKDPGIDPEETPVQDVSNNSSQAQPAESTTPTDKPSAPANDPRQSAAYREMMAARARQLQQRQQSQSSSAHS